MALIQRSWSHSLSLNLLLTIVFAISMKVWRFHILQWSNTKSPEVTQKVLDIIQEHLMPENIKKAYTVVILPGAAK